MSKYNLKVCVDLKIIIMECRTCLKITDELQDLLSEDCDLLLKIETITSIQILMNDDFPSKICNSCVANVELLYEFCDAVRRSNMILENRAYVELTEDDLIQIDEIKLEYEADNLDLNDPVEPKEEVIIEDVLSPGQNLGKTKLKKKAKKIKVYNCPQCDYITQDYKLIRQHRKKHLAKQDLISVCSICGKTIRTDNLAKHVSNHTEKPIACEICGKILKNRETLRTHRSVHEVVTIQCTYCEKIFHNRKLYRGHIYTHKNPDVKTKKCPMCEKHFRDKNTLNQHIRSHTGERPYPCEYCKKGFSSPHALKTHVRQHTKEKPFACDFCDMAFPQRVSLRTHLKSKHPDKTVEQSNLKENT